MILVIDTLDAQAIGRTSTQGVLPIVRCYDSTTSEVWLRLYMTQEEQARAVLSPLVLRSQAYLDDRYPTLYTGTASTGWPLTPYVLMLDTEVQQHLRAQVFFPAYAPRGERYTPHRWDMTYQSYFSSANPGTLEAHVTFQTTTNNQQPHPHTIHLSLSRLHEGRTVTVVPAVSTTVEKPPEVPEPQDMWSLLRARRDGKAP